MSFAFALNRALVGSLIAGFAFAASAQTIDQGKAAPEASKSGASTDSAFTKADTNHDGKLSKDEADRVPAIAAKFDQLDKDKKGYLTAEDFSAGQKSSY